MLIADLGCGSGAFTDILREKGFRCIGIDLSYRILDAECKIFSDVAFVNGDVDKPPIASESVDLILFSGMLHHLREKKILCKRKPSGA